MVVELNTEQEEPTETQHLLASSEIGTIDCDDEDPLTWPIAKKAAILGAVSFAVINDCLGSTIVNPGVSHILHEFHISNPAVAPFLISAHVIGLAIGPLIVSPASEIWGRCPLMHISNSLFLASLVIGALSPNMATLLISRVMIGMAGCVPVILEGGFITDLITTANRGKITAVWALAPLLGTALGPIIAGEMTFRFGWRSAFWLMALSAGIQAFAATFVLTETYVPALIRRRNLRTEAVSSFSKWDTFKTAIARPAKLSTRSPIVILSALNSSLTYVLFYLILSDLPTLLAGRYGFNSAQIGYAYASPMLGFLLGVLIISSVTDRIFQRRLKERGVSKPRDRLAALLPGTLIIVAGTLTYGWSVQAGMDWRMPLFGAFSIMFGISGVSLPLQQYLMDYFGPHVPSAITVCSILRCILATFLPSTAPSLYGSLGYGWGNTLIACVILVFCPTKYLLVHHEKRHGSSYTATDSC